MILRRGGIHPLVLRDAGGVRIATRAQHVLIISEDEWNLAMRSVIAIPIIPGDPQVGLFHVSVADLGYADASITQSFTLDSLGDERSVAEPAALRAASRAVAEFLDLDALARLEVRRPPGRQSNREWPRQKGIHWGSLGLDERKRLLVVTPDEHNALATYSTVLYVTSQDKRRRRRWQVPLDASWVTTGDLLLCRNAAMDQRRRPSPRTATSAEMGEVALGVRRVLA